MLSVGNVYELYRVKDILLLSYIFLRFLPPLCTLGTEEGVCCWNFCSSPWNCPCPCCLFLSFSRPSCACGSYNSPTNLFLHNALWDVGFGYSLSHACYCGQSPHIWGIAYSPRKQDKIQTHEKSWAASLDAEGDGGFRKSTYVMVHFWLHYMWITAVLETKPLKVPYLHQAPGDVEMLCWAGWKMRHRAGARSCMVYLNLFMDECMIVIPPHPKHYNGERVKSSPSSPLKQASARADDPSSPSSLSSPYSPASCLTYRCGDLLCSPPGIC